MHVLFYRQYTETILLFSFTDSKYLKLNKTLSKLFELFFIKKVNKNNCINTYKNYYDIPYEKAKNDFDKFINLFERKFGNIKYLKIYPFKIDAINEI